MSRFEAWCVANRVDMQLSYGIFDAITTLYEDPTDLSGIDDPFLRMQARSIITQASRVPVECWEWGGEGVA